MRTYYPLIDATPDGKEKIPLFPANTIHNGFGKSDFALADFPDNDFNGLRKQFRRPNC